jgi:dTDP-4-dehydrorhamnose reductase
MSTSAEAWLSGERVLITGGDGMLARGFREVLAGCRNAAVLALSRQELDITDRAAVQAARAWRPTIVVHCAALALADKCEREPEVARSVLVDGTRNVVDLCRSAGARLLFPQSVFIFDGRDLPVTEATEPFPPFIYGHLKLEAERLALEALTDALVIRMAGFFGGDERDKNFVGLFTRNLRRMLARGQSSCEVGDRIWQPTYTLDHARNSVFLLDRRCTGIYHMGSSGEASFYDVARACVEELRLQDVITIERCPAEIVAAGEPARRPLRMVTATVRLDREGLNLHRPWREGLGVYLARPYFADLRSQEAP